MDPKQFKVHTVQSLTGIPIYTWGTSQGGFQKLIKTPKPFNSRFKDFNSGVRIQNSFNLYTLKSHNDLKSSFQLFSRFYK